MADTISTNQMQTKVSVNKEKLLQIASMEDLSKTDYKVFLALLSQLSGFAARKTNGLTKDPANFTNISIKAISSKINVKKTKVLDSVNKLEDLGIIEVGNGDTVRNGYRFTF